MSTHTCTYVYAHVYMHANAHARTRVDTHGIHMCMHMPFLKSFHMPAHLSVCVQGGDQAYHQACL